MQLEYLSLFIFNLKDTIESRKLSLMKMFLLPKLTIDSLECFRFLKNQSGKLTNVLWYFFMMWTFPMKLVHHRVGFKVTRLSCLLFIETYSRNFYPIWAPHCNRLQCEERHVRMHIWFQFYLRINVIISLKAYFLNPIQLH